MERLRKFLTEELHLEPDPYMEKFELYQKILLEWNKKINMISRRSDSIEDHILNSVFFLKEFTLNENINIADIGTGGGFPGIPLNILHAGAGITLIDSISKKCNVLKDVISRMGLTNIKTVCARAEELSAERNFRHKYDIVISKAVASLDKLYLWGKDLLKKDGRLVCIKGGDVYSEIESLNSLYKKINIEELKFSFDPYYNIEDKKIIIIKKVTAK
ncbi:MAG: 16S rRNA (guanine(527)-N(7))-methyltransferase RsmG [Bacteroidetes bacterium]|nr:16S rRNA (guanine(527)-N(7))-methyltransferase RsmG [Bacteroidota bacterium]